MTARSRLGVRLGRMLDALIRTRKERDKGWRATGEKGKRGGGRPPHKYTYFTILDRSGIDDKHKCGGTRQPEGRGLARSWKGTGR